MSVTKRRNATLTPRPKLDEDDDFEILYIYVNNFPSSSISPSLLILEDEKIFCIDEHVGPNEVYILNPKVPNKLYNNQLLVNLKIKMPKLKLEHLQQFDITKSGKFITIGLDKEGVLRINQTHDEPKVPEYQTLNQKFGKLPPKPLDLKKIEKLFVKLDNIPATFDDPFKILIDGKLVFQFQKSVLLETELTINLPYPQDRFTFSCQNKACKQNYEKKYISENGEFFQVITKNKEIIVEQSLDKKFKEKVDHSKKLKIYFYILNCTDTSMKPFSLGSSSQVFFESSEMPQFKGVNYEFPILERKGDFILNIEVMHPSQGIMEEVYFNITDGGAHILLDCFEVGRMIFLQRKEEFIFQDELIDGTKKRVYELDEKCHFVFPEEEVDDNEENLLKLEFYKNKGFITSQDYDERVLKYTK